MSVKNKREKKNEDDAKKEERKMPPPPPPGRVGGTSKEEVSPSEGPAETPGRVATPQAGRATQPPRGKREPPVDDEPNVVLDESVVKDATEYAAENREKMALMQLLQKYNGIAKLIEDMKRKTPDANKRDIELQNLATKILDYHPNESKWEYAKAVILAIEDPSTKAEQLLRFARNQKGNGIDTTKVLDTLTEAVQTAKKDSDYDDVVKALIKIADTMGEYGMKDEARATLKDAFYYNRSMGTILGIIPVRGESSVKKKENKEEIEEVAKRHGLGHIKEPWTKRARRYLVVTVTALAAVLGLLGSGVEVSKDVTGFGIRDVLVKAGIMAPKKEAEKPKYASEKVFRELNREVRLMDERLTYVEPVEPIKVVTTIYDGTVGPDGEERPKINFCKFYGGNPDAAEGEKKGGKVRKFEEVDADIDSANKDLDKVEKQLQKAQSEEKKAVLEMEKVELVKQKGKLEEEKIELNKLANLLEEKYQYYYGEFCGVPNLRTQAPTCENIVVSVRDVNGEKKMFPIYDERVDCPDDCKKKGKPRPKVEEDVMVPNIGA